MHQRRNKQRLVDISVGQLAELLFVMNQARQDPHVGLTGTQSYQQVVNEIDSRSILRVTVEEFSNMIEAYKWFTLERAEFNPKRLKTYMTLLNELKTYNPEILKVNKHGDIVITEEDS